MSPTVSRIRPKEFVGDQALALLFFVQVEQQAGTAKKLETFYLAMLLFDDWSDATLDHEIFLPRL